MPCYPSVPSTINHGPSGSVIDLETKINTSSLTRFLSDCFLSQQWRATFTLQTENTLEDQSRATKSLFGLEKRYAWLPLRQESGSHPSELGVSALQKSLRRERRQRKNPSRLVAQGGVGREEDPGLGFILGRGPTLVTTQITNSSWF